MSVVRRPVIVAPSNVSDSIPTESPSPTRPITTTTFQNGSTNTNRTRREPTKFGIPGDSSSKRGQAVLFMSLALGIHLGGYELSRAAVMALFTSDGLGFGAPHGGTDSSMGGLSALPLAVGCVSPFSIALLWFYGKTLDYGGPRYALRIHTFIGAGAQIVAGHLLKLLNTSYTLRRSNSSLIVPDHLQSYSQPILFLLFVLQNAYVQLLYAQHWAYISSVLTPEEGIKLFAPIAGVGSIASTLAAGLVSLLVDRVGLIGLLYLAGASFLFSAVLADVAFGVAQRHGFEPKSAGEMSNNGESKEKCTGTTNMSCINASSGSSCTKGNIFQQANTLFRKVPVLGALFIEVIISQCLSSLINYIYLYKLKSSISNDVIRAAWSGNFFAWINGISGALQFFIIPILLKYFKAHKIWIFMPTLMLCCTSYQFVTNYSSLGLLSASASFFAIKTMEYSIRGAANEMLYVSLDYKSRYLGKKVISLIAGKFGKSAMAVVLSVVMAKYGNTSDTMWYILATAVILSFLWLISSIQLHALIESSMSSEKDAQVT